MRAYKHFEITFFVLIVLVTTLFVIPNLEGSLDEDKQLDKFSKEDVCDSYDIDYDFNGRSDVTEQGIEVGCTHENKPDRNKTLVFSLTRIEDGR